MVEKEFLGGAGIPWVPPITGAEDRPNVEFCAKEPDERKIIVTMLINVSLPVIGKGFRSQTHCFISFIGILTDQSQGRRPVSPRTRLRITPAISSVRVCLKDARSGVKR